MLHGESADLKGYRNDVVDPIISQLNASEHTKCLLVAKDYSDLTRNVVKGKQQKVYNQFIVKDAHVALFIIDGMIGSITKGEIDIAVEATRKKGFPMVYIYGTNVSEDNEILAYLNREGIYYQHFFDKRDLSDKIKTDLNVSIAKTIKSQKKRLVFILALLLCALFIASAIGMFTPNKPQPYIDTPHPESTVSVKEISASLSQNKAKDIVQGALQRRAITAYAFEQEHTYIVALLNENEKEGEEPGGNIASSPKLRVVVLERNTGIWSIIYDYPINMASFYKRLNRTYSTFEDEYIHFCIDKSCLVFKVNDANNYLFFHLSRSADKNSKDDVIHDYVALSLEDGSLSVLRCKDNVEINKREVFKSSSYPPGVEEYLLRKQEIIG